MPTLEPLSIVIVHSKFETPVGDHLGRRRLDPIAEALLHAEERLQLVEPGLVAVPSASWVSSASTRSRRTSRS
jgi:hypothetical protein